MSDTSALAGAGAEAAPAEDTPPSPRNGARDWVFDALTWCTLRLGGIGPVRRGIARHMEARIRPRGELPAAVATGLVLHGLVRMLF